MSATAHTPQEGMPPEPNDSKMCRAALAWAEAGREVFSVVYGKKSPATTHGLLDATRDPDQIRTMFPPGQKRNLGIRTGEGSGFLVIDADGYKEGAKDTLKALEDELGPLPETYTVRTRAGGHHYIFEYPEGRDLRSSVGEDGLGLGVDVRGNGGYIVGPGSWVGADSKGPAGSYKVINNAPMAKLPAAWIDRIEALSRRQKPVKVNGTKPSEGLAAFGANVKEGFVLPEVIREGSRNDTVFRYLGHLLGKGVPREIAEQAVRDANTARCQPPLDDAELELILKPRDDTGSGGQTGGDQEWPEPEEINFTLPSVPEFEVDEMLPPSQAENIRDEAERMQVPPEALAAARVVGLGALIGTQVYICPLGQDVSWMVPGVAFGFLCANPGRMKSECVAKGLAPIKALERELDARNKARRDEYEVAKVRYEVELAEFKKAVKSGAKGVVVPQPPEEPKPERLIAVDATVAKLGEICAASPNGQVLMERDEITGLLSQLGAPGHEGDREFYLTAWNGTSGYKVDRIGRGSLEIPQLALSLFGGVQPGKLIEYVIQTTKGGAGADGLLARMQYSVYPDYNQQYQHIDRRPNLEAYERACNAAHRLFAIDPTAIRAKTALGSGRHYLNFSTEAQPLFNKWREGLENSIRKGSLHPSLEGHFAKYRSLIPKTALIFHLVEGGTGPVTIDALIMAIRWGNFLAAHAKRIYAGALHGADLATKALADKVKAGKVANPFKVRDIYRAGWAGLSDKTDVEPAIEGLLDAGWLREEIIKGPGRTTSRYWINPKLAGKPA